LAITEKANCTRAGIKLSLITCMACNLHYDP